MFRVITYICNHLKIITIISIDDTIIGIWSKKSAVIE